MGKNAKKAYLEAIRWRYHQAKRLEKTKILDEFCAVCHSHRKYAHRKLTAAPLKISRSKPGKSSQYNRPETPAQRLMEHLYTTPEIKAKLQATLETHNPLVLRATI